MSAHADLRALADGFASDARKVPTAQAIELLQAAKAALEAAALAENTGSGDVDQALSALRDELDQTGLAGAAIELPIVDFLKLVLDQLGYLARRCRRAEASEQAYDGLRAEMFRMADQFAGAGTPVASRHAERIRQVLDEADELMGPDPDAREAALEGSRS